MTLVKFNPSNTINRNGLVRGFDGVFDSILNDTFFSNGMASVPAVNISDSKDHYHVELAAPGLRKEDFNLSLEKNMLTISVEKTHQDNSEERNYNKKEFSYTSFVRSFTLPDDADTSGIDAKYADGLLCINIAKNAEAKMQTRQIEIK